MDYDNIGFVVDTVGSRPTHDEDFLKKIALECEDTEEDTKPKTYKTKSKNPFDKFFDDMGYTDMGKISTRKKKQENKKSLKSNFIEPKKIENLLEKSQVLKPDFEKLDKIPDFNVSDKKLREERNREAEKTKGKNWFNLPATEMTEEVKKDLQVLQMRSVLDPKHFYKKNDLKVLPKFFQIGKVEDSALDYYSGRLTKKERKKTLVDELLADAEFQKYNKKKYQEILVEKQKTNYRAYKQAKRLKRKNKR